MSKSNISKILILKIDLLKSYKMMLSILENGMQIQIKEKELENKSGPVDHYMKDIGMEIRLMVRAD